MLSVTRPADLECSVTLQNFLDGTNSFEFLQVAAQMARLQHQVHSYRVVEPPTQVTPAPSRPRPDPALTTRPSGTTTSTMAAAAGSGTEVARPAATTSRRRPSARTSASHLVPPRSASFERTRGPATGSTTSGSSTGIRSGACRSSTEDASATATGSRPGMPARNSARPMLVSYNLVSNWRHEHKYLYTGATG